MWTAGGIAMPAPKPPGPPPPMVRPQVCDAAYPDVCIPPPPPDLDCPQVAERNFRVLPPDPHQFDGDRDGIGCER
jgi:micrococcal nuclease